MTYLERLVVAGVAVDDGERVDEAEAAEIADVVDQLRHGDDHLTTAKQHVFVNTGGETEMDHESVRARTGHRT